MDLSRGRDRQHHFAFACLVAIVCLQFASVCYAQNLGTQPATGRQYRDRPRPNRKAPCSTS